MASTKEFLEQYGSKTFEEHPFCDGDAILLCEVTYMPFNKAVSESFGDEPAKLPEICQRIFEYQGCKHQKLGLMITAEPSKRLMEIAASKRYADVKVAAVKRVDSVKPAVQFMAITFILPDGTIVVSYEGTDDTIAGWKEDVDMLIRKGTPAYGYAIDYIEEAAKTFDGKIIVIGHSKGGHEALYTALNCSQAVRDRIVLLYNNDGPGYYSSRILETSAYTELADRYRHFIPSSSFIGVMMAHDYDYKAVKSTKHLGPLQHDMHTWKIEDGNLVTVPDTDILSKITDTFLAKLVESTDDNDYSVMDKVMTDIIDGVGQLTLTDFSKNIVSSVGGAVKKWKALEPEVKDAFSGIFEGSGKLMAESIKAVRKGAEKGAEKIAKAVAEVV